MAARRRLRVMFVVSQPTRSPAISVHANLMRHLDPDGVEVHVLYNRRAEAEADRSALEVIPRDGSVHLVRAEFGPVGDALRGQLLAATTRAAAPALRDVARTVRYMRRHRIDVIHSEEGTRNAFYAYALTRVTRARNIVHFHSQYGSWMSAPSRFAVQRADGIIAVSGWTGAVIERNTGYPSDRMFPVLNGVDPAGFDPAGTDGAPIRRELGLADGDALIVSVAQLVEWKRQHILVDAFGRVADAHPTARLMLVGTEVSPENGYTRRLERQIADLGLGDRVVLAGHRPDVRQILAAAEVSSLPSVGDPCALAHLEAMAMARPVVAAGAGGTPELVQDGVTGLLSPPDDVDALARNLLALIDDRVRARKIGELGRARVLEYFNVRRMADDVEAVYRQVRSAPRRGHRG